MVIPFKRVDTLIRKLAVRLAKLAKLAQFSVIRHPTVRMKDIAKVQRKL
jgi:hypothetical protein